MVAICSCVFAFLRVALLSPEDCLELQSELAVSFLPMADNLPPCEDSGIRLGVKKRAVSNARFTLADARFGLRCSRRQIGTKASDVASAPHSHWPNGAQCVHSRRLV